MAKDTLVFRPREKFGICVATAAAADSPVSFKSRESPRARAVSLISSENPETSRLMVWTPPAINGLAMGQGCVSNIRNARRVRDGSYNDRDRLGQECVRA